VSGPEWYDLEFDALLIEQSIAKQYGVLPHLQGELSWPEWSKLVSGLMDDTPLGRVVAVRSERDRKMLEKFTPQQRKMRSEWSAFRARKAAKAFTGEQLRRQMDDLEQMMAKAFGS